MLASIRSVWPFDAVNGLDILQRILKVLIKVLRAPVIYLREHTLADECFSFSKAFMIGAVNLEHVVLSKILENLQKPRN